MQLEQLGPYRLSRRLGRGGMGTVFEGLNVETAQPAAVKVLNPHLAVEEGFRERFEIEIETLKKLKHPNIVRLYGFGQQDGVIFYAMELIHGTNLEDELQAGRRFNWRETTSLGIKLSRALQHAHDHGVVHRDLKPANLLLTADGDLKLADFGIARLFGNTRLTSAGGLVGTAEYMSPEQADGRAITPQCDLYSLGGVLFAMLAGRPPFSGASLPEVLQLHRFTEPPSVSRFAPDVPNELAEIIARLLAKDPAARGTNARVVAKQLAALEYALSIPRDTTAANASQIAPSNAPPIAPSATASPPANAPFPAHAPPPMRHEFELLPPGAATLQAPPPADPFSTLPGHPAQKAAGSRAIAPQPNTSQSNAPESNAPQLNAQPPNESLPSWARMPVTLVPSAGIDSLAERADQATFDGRAAASPPSPIGDSQNDLRLPSVLAYAGPNDSTAVADRPDLSPQSDNRGGTFGTAAASVLNRDPRSGLSSPPSSAANRFTTVEEDERRRAAADESAKSPAWIQVALLSIALAAFVGFGFYMMRPPSADALFARIETTVGNTGRPERLLDAEDNINRFLARFPDDPRAAQMKSDLEEIELIRLARQIELSPKLGASRFGDEPIAHDYADAIRISTSDPEHAAAKLGAIIEFYGQAPAPSETTSRFLELARRQRVRLIKQITEQSPAYLRLIEAVLLQAEQLRSTDPAKSRSLYSSIVELYADKPWAAAQVTKARAALAATQP